MKLTISHENMKLYFIPCAFMVLELLARIVGSDTARGFAKLCIFLCIFTMLVVIAYNLIPVRIVANMNELRINHIFPRKIEIDAINRVVLEEYSVRKRRARVSRVRLKIEYRLEGGIRELSLNDTKMPLTLSGKATGNYSALYDLHSYLNSIISGGKNC
ncbi:MAG: hypothetical protein ACI4Q4_07495 [Oscillospiraceae bacterium]